MSGMNILEKYEDEIKGIDEKYSAEILSEFKELNAWFKATYTRRDLN